MLIYLQMIETEEHRSKFEQIYVEYLGLMHHTAYKILQHEQDAEDAVHMAFTSIAENIEKIEPPSAKTKSYVATIAENKAIDLLRKHERHKVLSLEEGCLGLTVEYSGENHLADCILRLPALQREVIWLKYHHGFTLWEIAKILKISHAWATKLDQRAKAKLKELYNSEEERHVHR